MSTTYKFIPINDKPKPQHLSPLNPIHYIFQCKNLIPGQINTTQDTRTIPLYPIVLTYTRLSMSPYFSSGTCPYGLTSNNNPVVPLGAYALFLWTGRLK